MVDGVCHDMIRNVCPSEEHTDVRFRQAGPTQVVVNVPSKGLKAWLVGTVNARREAAGQVGFGVVDRLALLVVVGLERCLP